MKHVKRRSSITNLPKELVEEINTLLLEPSVTYADLAEFCKAKGYDISKSSIGRYGKNFLEQYRQIRVLEDQARAIQSEPGDGMLLDEALSKLLLQKILGAVMSGELDVVAAPKMISEISKLQQTNINREKFKTDFAEKMKTIAESAEEMAREKGMTETDAADIRDRLISEVDAILGL